MAYEVFISFKRNRLDGKGITRDYVLAKDLHQTLTQLGINTFFSEKDISSSAFLQQIHDALKQARILILVGTSVENIESPYVKHEWELFLNEILNRSKPDGEIYPYLEGMSPYMLPIALSNRDSFDSARKNELVHRIYRNLRKQSLVVPVSPPPPPETITLKKSYIVGGAVGIAAVVIVLALLINAVSNIGWPPVSSDGSGESEILPSSWEESSVEEPTTTTQNTSVPSGIGQVSVGDTVTLGRYPQRSESSNDPIKWRVLDVEDGKALLVSKKLLDCVCYNEPKADVTWQSCKLRSWLNNGFYNTAFSSSDQDKIYRSTVVNNDNPKFGTNGGSTTQDYLFLLSVDEVKKYFTSDIDRRAGITNYAKMHEGYSTDDSLDADGDPTGWWWLRTPGENNSLAVHVRCAGSYFLSGSFVNYTPICVRPAMWVCM